MSTLWAAVAQARPAAGLVRDVVLEIALARGPPADRAGAGGVPDLGQVPEFDPGVVALGLAPVITGPGCPGIELDDQVRPGPRGPQPPGPVPARRPLPSLGGEAESRPSVRWSRPGFPGFFRLPWPLGAGRAHPCPDRVAVIVGHCHAPRRTGFRAAAVARSRASHGSIGPIPPIAPGRSASREIGTSGTVRVPAPRTRRHPGPTAPVAAPGPGAARARRSRLGAGVLIQQQVQVRAGPQLIHPRPRVPPCAARAPTP